MYQIEFRPRAAQDFENLDEVVAGRVLKKLRWLAENFDSIKPENPWRGPFPVSSSFAWATTGSFTKLIARRKC